jgi:glycosyltransferase involved in cell wall biosynthesis
MDYVVVPSSFCAEAFRHSGVTSKIFISYLGIDDRYVYRERSREDPFTFLAFIDRGRRKGGIYALNAFVNEFGDDPRVRLILKHREKVVRGHKVDFVNPNIETIYQDLTVEQLCFLYHQCHCLVNPNRGEGFGLIPREFVASGGIALTTNWGATAEMLDLWGYPIGYKLEKADWSDIEKFRGMDLGEWATPSERDLQQKMRWIFDNRESLIRGSLFKSLMVKRMYTWESLAEDISNIWRYLINGYRSSGTETQTEGRLLVHG